MMRSSNKDSSCPENRVFTITPIGVIHTPFMTKGEVPVQGVLNAESIGNVEVFNTWVEGLKDIELFSHIILFYLFDQASELCLVRPTFFDDEPHGVFASRHPARPNGIGITVVRLVNRRGNILEVQGVDMLDGTPLIDIKPYIPRFDCFPHAGEGWLTGEKNRPKPPGRE